MRALVVGADGFVGRHLVRHLEASGDDVRQIVGPHAPPSSGATALDVRDGPALASAVAAASPEAVYHLVAVAFGPDASADPAGAIGITVQGTVNLLEAASALPDPPIVLVSGSAEVYGAPSVERITESEPVRPVNVYGASKAAQEAMALAWGHARGLPVVCTRSFNHIGPGQRSSFALPSFARQLASIAAGSREARLRVGNLAPVRDFTDVRDVVGAYRLLVAGRHVGEPINVASGHGISIGDLLSSLIAISGLGVEVEVDPQRVRHGDPPRIVGDPARIGELTGWRPERTLESTLRDVWEEAFAQDA